LWSDHKDKEGIYLVRWDSLARPKSYGGWWIKIIFQFATKLLAKSLWRGLFSSSMWNEVIKEKYLK